MMGWGIIRKFSYFFLLTFFFFSFRERAGKGKGDPGGHITYIHYISYVPTYVCTQILHINDGLKVFFFFLFSLSSSPAPLKINTS
ncbi:hypothetical protein F5X96DRAFT_640513 [Biscogniauxia mediterranea]|nr:hypothetical protein F5X96DRAFT_640513 [Biscogniauxia mediterranea]